MSKIIIPVMDGASASFRNRHIRTYMSDVVRGVVVELMEKTPLTKPVYQESVRGGAIFSRKRGILRFIESHNRTGNVLLCVGKSYGGYNLIELLKEFMPASNYDKVVLFLVDACSLDKIIGKKEWIRPPKVNELYNFYQSNNRHMNGYKIESTMPQLHQTDLSAVPGLNHWTITENESLKRELTRVIAGLISD